METRYNPHSFLAIVDLFRGEGIRKWETDISRGMCYGGFCGVPVLSIRTFMYLFLRVGRPFVFVFPIFNFLCFLMGCGLFIFLHFSSSHDIRNVPMYAFV